MNAETKNRVMLLILVVKMLPTFEPFDNLYDITTRAVAYLGGGGERGPYFRATFFIFSYIFLRRQVNVG